MQSGIENEDVCMDSGCLHGLLLKMRAVGFCCAPTGLLGSGLDWRGLYFSQSWVLRKR